jgi:hypothetical protein
MHRQRGTAALENDEENSVASINAPDGVEYSLQAKEMYGSSTLAAKIGWGRRGLSLDS